MLLSYRERAVSGDTQLLRDSPPIRVMCLHYLSLCLSFGHSASMQKIRKRLNWDKPRAQRDSPVWGLSSAAPHPREWSSRHEAQPARRIIHKIGMLRTGRIKYCGYSHCFPLSVLPQEGSAGLCLAPTFVSDQCWMHKQFVILQSLAYVNTPYKCI